METDNRFYILFPNHHQGLRLSQLLRERGIDYLIAPTPRQLSTCCGISLIVKGGDLEEAGQVIAEHEIVVEKIAPAPKRDGDWKYRSC